MLKSFCFQVFSKLCRHEGFYQPNTVLATRSRTDSPASVLMSWPWRGRCRGSVLTLFQDFYFIGGSEWTALVTSRNLSTWVFKKERESGRKRAGGLIPGPFNTLPITWLKMWGAGLEHSHGHPQSHYQVSIIKLLLYSDNLGFRKLTTLYSSYSFLCILKVSGSSLQWLTVNGPVSELGRFCCLCISYHPESLRIHKKL